MAMRTSGVKLDFEKLIAKGENRTIHAQTANGTRTGGRRVNRDEPWNSPQVNRARRARRGVVIGLLSDAAAARKSAADAGRLEPRSWSLATAMTASARDQSKHGVDLSDYQTDPIDPGAIDDFLQNNSQLHGDMNGVLGLQSADLQDVDIRDDRQFEAWCASLPRTLYAELKLEI